MQKLFNFWLGLLLVLPLVFGCSNPDDARPVQPQPDPQQQLPPATVVYLVRHAEKEASSSTDPGLSAAGQERALALKQELKQEPVAALFATPYKRTSLTLQPLADELKLPVTTYQPQDYMGLAQQIMKNYKGKTVVVAGHSNTTLEIIEALGAERPVKSISETDYDYLFRVNISPEGTATAEVQRYGK